MLIAERAAMLVVAPRLSGVIVPMLTPLTDDGEALRYDAIPPLVEFLVTAGVQGLFVAGTTSEGPLLQPEERRQLLELTVTAAAGRVPVVLNVGATTTVQAASLARFAAASEATAVAATTPYYYSYAPAQVADYYRAIAEACAPLPVYLYSIPSRTANHVSPALAADMSEVANVVGIKDSTGEMAQLLDYLQIPDFTVLSGSDVLSGAALLAGAHGLVSGLAGVTPEPFVALWQAHIESDAHAFAAAYTRVLQVARVLRHGTNLGLLKALASQRVAANRLDGVERTRPYGLLGPARAPQARVRVDDLTAVRSELDAWEAAGGAPTVRYRWTDPEAT